VVVGVRVSVFAGWIEVGGEDGAVEVFQWAAI
jgi:hypothetical protein